MKLQPPPRLHAPLKATLPNMSWNRGGTRKMRGCATQPPAPRQATRHMTRHLPCLAALRAFADDAPALALRSLRTTIDVHLQRAPKPPSGASPRLPQSTRRQLGPRNTALTRQSTHSHHERPFPPPLRQGRFPRARRRSPRHCPPRARGPAEQEDRGWLSADGAHALALLCFDAAANPPVVR
jgi:hypothetical protein